jgi:hypothetical protein
MKQSSTDGARARRGAADEPETVVAKDPSVQPGTLKAVGGSASDEWNNRIANDTIVTLWLKNSDPETRQKQISGAIAGLVGINPRDELEGMMAAQLIASHSAVMECYRRAMIGDQTFQGRSENLNQANKLSRTFTTLLDALNKHRGKGQQKVTVEHVHVHSGGQAIVGAVAPGGGITSKDEEQRHAKQLPYAPEPPLRSADAARDPVSVTSDGERPLPDARRTVAGGAER